MTEIKKSTCDGVSITVLCDNYADSAFSEDIDDVVIRKSQGLRCLGEHGLSLFLEVKNGEESTFILFDTGSVKKSLLINIQELGIDLKKAKHLVISHGHFDHIGAILEAIEMIPNVQVWMHPKIDTQYQALRGGEFELPEGKEKIDKKEFRKLKKNYPMVIPLKMVTPLNAIEEKIKSVNGTINKFEGIKEIIPGVYAYNNLKYYFESERPKGFLKQEGNMFSYADYVEETYMALNVKNKGWIILAGCSHSGILNAIETIKNKFQEPIHAVIGGFHLFKITEKRLNDTLEYFKKINPKIISPMHCTSRQFYDHIKVEMQDPVVNSTVGTVFNF